MKNSIKLSIVIPSYNQGAYIEQTIESILSQDYPNKDLIIVDGGSTDNSVEIIKKYEKHLAWWVSEPDKGQAHAINKGLKKITGDFFNWINSDDYLEPGALNRIAKSVHENPDAEVICGYTNCFFDETCETSHSYRMVFDKTVSKTILNPIMNQPGSFYRLDAVKALGGINESLNYVFDDELWFRYLCNRGRTRIVFIEETLAHFRLHQKAKSAQLGDGVFYNELVAVWHDIAVQTRLPSNLLNYHKGEVTVDYYHSSRWDFSYLDINEFHAFFCEKYQYLLYKDYKYKEARKCVLKSWTNRNGIGKLKFWILFAKLFIFGPKLMHKLRLMNN